MTAMSKNTIILADFKQHIAHRTIHRGLYR